MNDVIKAVVKTRDGEPIEFLIETREPELADSAEMPVARSRPIAGAAREFEVAFDLIAALADHLTEHVRSLTRAPDKVDVKFGIKLSASAGIIMATAASEANIEVSLTWQREVA